jgi:hypothetical protein
MNTRGKNWIVARYFGLKVEVVYKLNQCSLILFRDREFVVDTRDLVFGEALPRLCRSLQKAA